MSICSAGIIGFGMYAPEKVLTNLDLEKMVDTNDTWIQERTGIKERHIVAKDEATSDMAIAAARNALFDANMAAEDIDLIIVATASQDCFFPSVSCLVQHAIGAKRAAAFDLAAGCSGFVYALATASQFVQSGLYRNVLVVGADALSRITDWEDRNTCVLFGDGAGAVVVSAVADGYGVIGIELGADGSGGDLLKIPAGGSRLPASHATVDERQHFIRMNGNEVYKFAVRVVGSASLKALAKAGLTSEDVDMFFPHQANLRIIEAAAKRLKLSMDKVWVNVDRYGNTSAASIPIALAEAKAAGSLHDGMNIVLVGFGAGLTWAACAIKMGGKIATNA